MAGEIDWTGAPGDKPRTPKEGKPPKETKNPDETGKNSTKPPRK